MQGLLTSAPRLVILLISALCLGLLPSRVAGSSPLAVVLVGAALFAAAWRLARHEGGRLEAGRAWLARNAHSAGLCSIGIGLALRLAWVLAVPPRQVSDFHEYWGTAVNLLRDGAYWVGGPDGMGRWYAYRPPGAAAELAAGMAVFGEWTYLPALINSICFAVAAAALLRTGECIGEREAGAAACAGLALWPTGIAYTGMAASEPLFLALISASLWLISRQPAAGVSGLLGGVLNGLAVLVRPTVLPMPAIWLLSRWRDRSGATLVRLAPWLALASLGMAAAVGPWMYRNYRLLGKAVVSTNMGANLYLSNNPDASPDYNETWVRAVYKEVGYDELRHDELAAARAKEWILANPQAFLRLTIQKLPVFVGDDGSGVYWSLRVPYDYQGKLYGLLLAISQAWWGLVWLLVAAGALRRPSAFSIGAVRIAAWTVAMFLFTGLPFGVQPRYHLPMVPYALLVCGLFFSRRDELNGRRQPLGMGPVS